MAEDDKSADPNRATTKPKKKASRKKTASKATATKKRVAATKRASAKKKSAARKRAAAKKRAPESTTRPTGSGAIAGEAATAPPAAAATADRPLPGRPAAAGREERAGSGGSRPEAGATAGPPVSVKERAEHRTSTSLTASTSARTQSPPGIWVAVAALVIILYIVWRPDAGVDDPPRNEPQAPASANASPEAKDMIAPEDAEPGSSAVASPGAAGPSAPPRDAPTGDHTREAPGKPGPQGTGSD
jgi:hypothetical protein